MRRFSFLVLPFSIIGVFAVLGCYYATRPAPLDTGGAPRFSIAPSGPRTRGQSTPALRSATERERALAIRSVVAQLEAFKRDDYRAATRFQSSALQRNFASIDDFRRVIQSLYPQFADYRKAHFGEARANRHGTRVEIPVTLTGRDGVVVEAEYSMVLENGLYRVAGVNGGIADHPTPHSAPMPDDFQDIEEILPLRA